MSAVLRSSIDTQNPNILKDKAIESFTSTFKAVNDRCSPPTPRGFNAGSARQSPTQYHEQRRVESGYRSTSNSVFPENSSTASSSDSPKERNCSGSSEKDSHEVRCIEAPTNRSLPLTYPASEHEGRLTAEHRKQNSYQEVRDLHSTEPGHGSLPPMAAPRASMGQLNRLESESSTYSNQLDARPINTKKRQRPFVNRTRTGCRTCRRRKKKCDEAKPECNNCTRGGFVCEGYASKVHWSKNGVTKPPPPLQAKEPMALHSESVRSSSQSLSDTCAHNGPEGTRVQPIVVEDQERTPPAPSRLSNHSKQPPHVSYQELAAPVPVQHTQLPALNSNRPPSHNHHMSQSQKHPPPPQQHNPRVYHHIPQSMSQTPYSPPAVVHSYYQMSQPPRQLLLVPSTSTPLATLLSYHKPQPRAYKTEKAKMLRGEPFLQYDGQLMDERAQCTGAVYGFNSTANPSVVIARGDRERNFKRIVAAGWLHPPHRNGHPEVHVTGHLGESVNVTTPFHCDYGYNLSIGDYVNIGPHCQLLDSARIAIGRNTKIGARVTISTLGVPSDPKSLKGSNGTEIAREVSIGENVYIGDCVIIQAGVSIGNNTIIRSGSVVVRDIEPDVVAHGNPALG